MFLESRNVDAKNLVPWQMPNHRSDHFRYHSWYLMRSTEAVNQVGVADRVPRSVSKMKWDKQTFISGGEGIFRTYFIRFWSDDVEKFFSHSVQCREVNICVVLYHFIVTSMSLNMPNSGWSVPQKSLTTSSAFKEWKLQMPNKYEQHKARSTSLKRVVCNCIYTLAI